MSRREDACQRELSRWNRIRAFHGWHEVVVGGLLLVLLLLADYRMPGFLKFESQLLLSRQLWEIAILSLGITLIMVSGGIDLSIGSTMGLSAVTLGISYSLTGHLAVSCIAGVVCGGLCGAWNGVLVSRLQLHPLIVTLATAAAYRGIAEGVSQGASYSRFGEDFSRLARGNWHGVPFPGLAFAALALLSTVYLGMTPAGRYLYAIGQNERASRFSGVPVDRIRFRLYTTSGLLAGLAAVIYVARFDTARADAGRGFELDVITAVIAGGTSIAGGQGSIPGTVLGLMLIHETRLFVTRCWKIDELRSIVIGLLLIVAVLLCQTIMRGRRQ